MYSVNRFFGRDGRNGVVATACLVFLFQAGPAAAAEAIATQRNLDLVWLMATAALVMMMQVGFLLLEAGMVRSKNSINVAQKNLLDFVFGIVAFAVVGFMIAFGRSGTLPIGLDWNLFMLDGLDSWQMAFFVFQVMFCATAATIVSGAVAERMRLSAYVAGSLILSGLIYPVFVHWAWGSGLFANEGSFLGNAGFVDFAGSTVVHATGGWISLAACLVIGPRTGRFDENGRPVRINGHSPVLSTTGALLLFFGWIGFNGGSTMQANTDIAAIILNTVLAGGVGCTVGYAISIQRNGIVLPEKPYSGMLGGLVAVTAGCHILTPAGAMAIGAIGAMVAIHGIDFIERVWKIDDAVGAIGVHAFAGVAGTLLLAVLAPVESLPTGSRLAQLSIQAGGSLLNFAWSFSIGYGFFWLLNRYGQLRVSVADEEIGLNMVEHATRLGVGHVEDAFSDLLGGKADLGQRLPVEAGSDAEKLTGMFNQLMDKLEEQERVRLEMEAFKREREEAERVTALADATFEAIFIHRDGIIVDANAQFGRLFGGETAEIIGRSLMELVAPEQRERAAQALAEGSDASFETIALDRNGARIPIEARARDILYRNAPARVVCLVDLRERREAEQRIRHIAQHDPLTGLPNRALFNNELEARTGSANDGASCALVLVDVDRFKDINDIHGHQAGDAVIREVAARLASVAGANGFVARLGGDEFALVVPNVIFDSQLVDIGRRTVDAFRRPVALDSGERLACTVSIGMARYPDHADNAKTLVAHADIALYESKNAGRNCWTVFKAGMNALIEKRRELEAALGRAIEGHELELFLQPRISAKSGEIIGYEGLLRWMRPDAGVVSPVDFIPVAEASGKIIAIGEWVVTEACRMLSEGLGGRSLSINVSPLQFRHPGFVDNLVRIVHDAGVAPERLELEITESVLIDDDSRALYVLKELKRHGFGIALDDFGTGYSSLSYLSRYPFDTLKVDRSFVANLSNSNSAPVIIRSIVELGSGLGMKVVAEGVETLEEALFLAGIGCDQLQGYLLGRPAPMSQRIVDIDSAVAAAIGERARSRRFGPDLQRTTPALHRDEATDDASLLQKSA
jgi:Amt family ammonium transporter